MNFLLVGLGGFFGSIARFSLGSYISKSFKSKIPIGTMIINITGAILLGILTSYNSSGNLYLLLGDGFLGAYTTFSTFMFEGFNLFSENKKLNAIIYIALSLFFGILGYMLGNKIFLIIKNLL